MHAGLLRSHPDVSVVGIADPQPDLREGAAKDFEVEVFADAEKMIGRTAADVALVCTPTYLHAPHSLAALRAGLHVFCEKPMALDVVQCTEMIDAANAGDRILTVGQVLRFWPEYVYLKQAIASGEHGNLRTLTLRRVGQVTRGWQDWFLDEKRGGTQMFDRHIHDTDLVLWLLGLPSRVSATARVEAEGGFVHSFTHYSYPQAMVFAEGSADFAPSHPFTMEYTAVFQNATVAFSSTSEPTLRVYPESGAMVAPPLPTPVENADAGLNISAANAYFYEQVELFRCIREGVRPTVVTPESARETVRVVRAEIDSARNGTPESLE